MVKCFSTSSYRALVYTSAMGLVLLLSSHVSEGFVFGKPEPGDDPKRSASATTMLNRLYEAAKERADRVRAAEGTNPAGPANARDMFAQLVDYTRDKINNPPLLSTERNFIMVDTNLRMLAAEVHDLRKIVMRLARGNSRKRFRKLVSRCKPTSMHYINKTSLVPVQGKKYTKIKG